VLLTEQRAEYAKRPWRASRDQKAYKALSEKLGFAVRPHDLRRTLGQWVKDKYGPAAMHAVLGHAELTLTRTYGPAPSTERVREIMELWSDYYLETLARVLAGDDQADVGQIRRILEERKIARKLTAMTDEQVRELIEGARR
jgi:hypothetical protein